MGDILGCALAQEFSTPTPCTLRSCQKRAFCPYVVCSARNNGIRGFIKKDLSFLNPGKTLSFVMDAFSVFYQENPYFTDNKIGIYKAEWARLPLASPLPKI
ncbi:hypothetical protein [Helicobacter sp. L8]|uniref:hypothetical protein n=1 Tax=Helicobacter sp. L8 TaxID=2316078 RepID=UPI000EB57ADC|nr:hypothetical protein [Helicobacter sp. L8]